MKAKLLLIALIAHFYSLTAIAYDAYIDGIYYEFSGSDASVVRGEISYSGSVVIPSSINYNDKNYVVTTIGVNAFWGCRELTSIFIPGSVVSIGKQAFYNCKCLTSVTLSKGLRSIGIWAFLSCESLPSITIPETVTYIADGAFSWCSGLTSIVVEEGNTVYDSRNGCNAIIKTGINCLVEGCMNTIIPEDITIIESNSFTGCTGLTSITIPNSVTTIGGAFSDCRGLTTITIPKNVSYIQSTAFTGCSALTSIVVDEENTTFDSRYGCNAIIETASNKLIKGCANTVIPEDVMCIAMYAFSGCGSQTSLNIPESVTNIEAYAFFECDILTSINIPNSITTIGDRTFAYCSRLTSVNIPNSITSIDYGAFAGCKALTSITIPKSVVSIGSLVFQDCESLSSIILGADIPIAVTPDVFSEVDCSNISLRVPRGSKTAYQAADVWNDFGEIIEYNCVDVPDQTIVVGDSTTMEINVNNFDTDLVAFQMDLSLPEGVSIDKTGCSLSSRITDEEQELTIGKLENGAYRLISSSLSLTPIYGNEGTLLTLKLTAKEGSVGGQATISNIRFSTSESEHVTMDDETFDINVMYKVIYTVDGEEYKTVNVLYNTPITYETEPTKEGYTFSGWSEIPDTMPAHNVEVTGNFTINKYKLTYIVGGVEYKSYEIDYAATIMPEVEPTQEGYTFSGWIGLPETMPAHDVEVTGAFTINSYTLTYLVDSEPYKTFSVVYGSDLILEAEPTKDGYTFGGWSELPETMPAHDVEVTGRFYLFGDVNTDEEVDVVDVVDVARFVVATPSEKFREKLADLNFDNMVNLGDAVVLVNHIAGDQNFAREMVAPEYRTDTSVLSLTTNGKTLALNLTNGQAYTAFQFDLYVAEDADVAQMKLNRKRQQKHQLLYNKVADGHYRVAALSTSNDTFQDKAGELLSLVIDDAQDADIEICNILFFDTKGNDYAFDTIGVDQETGVNNVNGNNNVNDNIYDLQGRKLSKLQRGVNIIGGKKILVK